MEERTTGTLPGDSRQTGTLPIDRQTGTLASDRQTGTLPMDRQTGTLPIDNQSNRVTSTLQSDINSRDKYNNYEDEYIYDLEIGEVIKGNNDDYTISEQFSYGGQAEIYKVQTVLGKKYIAKIYRVRKQNRYSDDIVKFLSKNTKPGKCRLPGGQQRSAGPARQPAAKYRLRYSGSNLLRECLPRAAGSNTRSRGQQPR